MCRACREEKLLGAESLCSRDGVARVAFDNILHRGQVFKIGEIGNGVHPTIGDMVTDSFLEVDEAAGLREEGCHAGTTKAVPLL